MPQDNIFTVKNEDFDRLTQNTAVEFFQRLLWAEARRLGMEISKINVSDRVNVPDGGVDATVNQVQSEAGSGIIKPGKTVYQIKSGKTKPNLKDELLGKEGVKTGIQACLDADGTYVLVCTGIDLVDREHREILSQIKDYLKPYSKQPPKVDVWSQNTLRGFVERFPSLALDLKGLSDAKFQTHRSWSQDDSMQVQFFPGQAQIEFIEKLQNELRQNDDTIHVRVLGEPGIGKTRLVLEATKVADLSPLVIYCTAVQFRDSVLIDALLRADNPFSTIVVIDECDPGSGAEFWYKLRHRGPRIKLVTIYNDYEERSSGIIPYTAPPLAREQIRSIIQGYTTNLSKVSSDRWAELCGGSPRVAHVIGQNLVKHPEDVLTPPDTVDIWERYIAAGDNDSEKTEHRRVVLQHLALFKRFGYERSVASEAQAIAEKVKAANPQITLHKFEEIIYELRERKILQGEFTLYITPKALHIKLWTQWWERHHRLFNLEQFTQDLPPKLIEWFYEMFKYAAESDAASRIVGDLLGPNGPFRNDEYLKTKLGSRFFLALTEAAPESALKCLNETVGKWNRETLLQFTAGRRNIVCALEKIAFWRTLFTDAARLLLALGEAENDGCSNNASGVFTQLFSPGYGPVAHSEASPAERFPVLEEALKSNSKKRRALALRACDAGLTSELFSRIGNAEYQGLRKEPEFWVPKTYAELWDAYYRVWQLLSERLTFLAKDERKEGVNILLKHAGAMMRIPDLADTVVNTVRIILAEGYATEKQLITALHRILFQDDAYVNNKDLPVETRKHLEQLREDLLKGDFSSMMQRYVGMDLPEDNFDNNKDYLEQEHPQIHELAQQAVDTPSLLQSELHWLVTTEAQNGYRFGKELCRKDVGFSLLPMLLDAQRNAKDNASTYFLCGYFRSLFDEDRKRWEEQLDALGEDTTLSILIPELMSYSGMTDAAGSLLLKLAKKGSINSDHFGMFIFGKGFQNLSSGVFKKWIEFLLDFTDKPAAAITLKLYHRYYILHEAAPPLPLDTTFRVLTHPSFFEESSQYRTDMMLAYHWTEIGKMFLHLYPEKALELIEQMLVHFGREGTIFDPHSRTTSVLTEITKQYPGEVWKRVSKCLEEQEDFRRTISLGKWLREADLSDTEKGKGALTLIPHEKIWEWVDRDVENRAWYLARKPIPKTLSLDEWQDSLARALLVRYGERDDVRSTLISNYLTEGWWGPASLHYKAKLQKLRRIKNSEANENVKRWINDFVDLLEKQVEEAKISEERKG